MKQNITLTNILSVKIKLKKIENPQNNLKIQRPFHYYLIICNTNLDSILSKLTLTR